MALLLALAVAGCGGGDQPADAAPRLTKPQLVRQLGDICQEHTDRQVAALERFDSKHGIPQGVARPKVSGAQLERELVEVILPIVHDTIHDVGRLRPPADEEAAFEAFIRALEHGVAVSERDPSWVATEKFEPFMRARGTAAALGAYFCGQA